MNRKKWVNVGETLPEMISFDNISSERYFRPQKGQDILDKNIAIDFLFPRPFKLDDISHDFKKPNDFHVIQASSCDIPAFNPKEPLAVREVE